jgi:ribosomal protein L37E
MKKCNYWQDSHENWYLQQCPECGKSNHEASVATGVCAWCGFDIRDYEPEEQEDDDDVC